VAVRTIDVHAHVLFPKVMGKCGAAGPEMGVRDGVQFFRSGDYVLENVRFVDAPFSDLERRLELMARLRIDHRLLSPPLTKRLTSAGVDREVRGRDHASDHAPAWIEVAEAAKAPPGRGRRVRKESLR